ncbi:MAG: hypothetical protein AMXMBFR12_07210 [Candidatus Babeliales bacterium]
MKKRFEFESVTEFEQPEQSPGYLLWKVSTQWRGAIEDVLKPLGLTHPQFVIMASLGWLTRKGNKVTQVAIGKSASLDPNTTSQILRGLEKRKLIKRTQLSDERSKNPVLTDAGSALLAKALPAVEKADAQFFSVLSSKESKNLLHTFQALVDK